MANPETCRHNILQAALDIHDNVFVICVSCESTIDPQSFERWELNQYEYDIDHNVWVWKNPYKTPSDCPYCPPQKGCNSLSPSRRLEAVGTHAAERFREVFNGSGEVDADRGLPTVRSEQPRSSDELSDGADQDPHP